MIGTAFAMRERDWLFPGFRELGAVLWRGMSLHRYLDHAFGNERDAAKGRQTPDHFTFREGHVVSVGSPFGNQTTQAVGFGWAAKMKGDDVVAVSTMSEAETSSGEFHNALNFAGVFKAPVVFVVRNNLAAPSGPEDAQTGSETIAEKAIAYGLPSVRVDGNDLLAVIRVVREAIANASEQGATLIEAMTYRADDAQSGWRDVDPIARTHKLLARSADWTDERDRQIESQVDAELNEAISQASNARPPALETMFDDVYQTPPWHLGEQQRELLAGPRFGSK